MTDPSHGRQNLRAAVLQGLWSTFWAEPAGSSRFWIASAWVLICKQLLQCIRGEKLVLKVIQLARQASTMGCLVVGRLPHIRSQI